MEEIILDVEPRKELGRASLKDLRESGFIPCIVYSAGKDSQSIKVAQAQVLKLLHQHRLESSVIGLRINPHKKTKPCLIKELQYNPVKGDIIHIDFNEISLSKAIKINVPVVSKGESVGVKLEGGSLEQIFWEIEVECLPTDIPKQIEIDISQLKMGEAVHIKDITLPSQIKLLNDPEAVVFSVVAPLKEEVPAEAVAAEETQEPEVIKEKKPLPEEATQEEEKKEKEKK